METNVTLNISLTLKAQGKTQEEIEGAAYWFLQPFLEQFTGENTIGEIAEGVTLKGFNIAIE